MKIQLKYLYENCLPFFFSRDTVRKLGVAHAVMRCPSVVCLSVTFVYSVKTSN